MGGFLPIAKVGLGFADLDLFSLFVEFETVPKIVGELGTLPFDWGLITMRLWQQT